MASAVVERHVREDRCAVIELRGELDLASQVALRHPLLDLVRDNPPAIPVNMQHVSFIDSTGFGALVARYKAARGARRFRTGWAGWRCSCSGSCG